MQKENPHFVIYRRYQNFIDNVKSKFYTSKIKKHFNVYLRVLIDVILLNSKVKLKITLPV